MRAAIGGVMGGAWRTICGAEIILYAGAVHSPATLLRSGVGPEAHIKDLGLGLRARLPVGACFQDHPAIFLLLALNDFAVPPPGSRHTNLCVRYNSGLAGAGPNELMIVVLNRFGDSLGHHWAKAASRPAIGLLGVWVNQCFSRGNLRLASIDPSAQSVPRCRRARKLAPISGSGQTFLSSSPTTWGLAFGTARRRVRDGAPRRPRLATPEPRGFLRRVRR